ncbi:MAG: hypothetical protein ACHQM6_05150, partial [Candidatus Kapaibacterium sp.]
MKRLLSIFPALVLFAILSGCSKSSSPTDSTPPITETTFAFHKPRLGATFTMQASRTAGPGYDTTYVFTVTDTATSQAGKSNVLQLNGYYQYPFYISYRANGDIDIWGSSDYIFGRDLWTWYPLGLANGEGTETFRHDSVISNPDPNDTRQLERDMVTGKGKDTLIIKGQPVECIRVQLASNYTLTDLK